jgi:hypothetical protein
VPQPDLVVNTPTLAAGVQQRPRAGAFPHGDPLSADREQMRRRPLDLRQQETRAGSREHARGGAGDHRFRQAGGRARVAKGGTYPMDVFQAERHTSASDFRFETNISCFTPVPVPK